MTEAVQTTFLIQRLGRTDLPPDDAWLEGRLGAREAAPHFDISPGD